MHQPDLLSCFDRSLVFSLAHVSKFLIVIVKVSNQKSSSSCGLWKAQPIFSRGFSRVEVWRFCVVPFNAVDKIQH